MKRIDHQRHHLDRTTTIWVDIYVYEEEPNDDVVRYIAETYPAGTNENHLIHPATFDRSLGLLIIRQRSELILDRDP